MIGQLKEGGAYTCISCPNAACSMIPRVGGVVIAPMRRAARTSRANPSYLRSHPLLRFPGSYCATLASKSIPAWSMSSIHSTAGYKDQSPRRYRASGIRTLHIFGGFIYSRLPYRGHSEGSQSGQRWSIMNNPLMYIVETKGDKAQRNRSSAGSSVLSSSLRQHWFGPASAR